MENNVKNYFELKKIYESLAKENAKLQSLSKEAFIKIVDNDIYINDSLYLQQYQFLGAKVVNNTINKRNNYIVLDKGSSNGIEPDMGVIGSNGIVGIVKDVSKNFCSVISVLHKKTHISTQIKKNKYFGILIWEGKDAEHATLSDISTHVELDIGDTLVTRGSSTIFPANILVGTISEFSVEPGEDFSTINVKLSTDFRNLTHVYIVKNLLKEEQLKLEENFDD